MKCLNVKDQCRDMKKNCPMFNLDSRSHSTAVWTGLVRPLMRTYQVQIQLHLDRSRERGVVSTPYVQVLAPQLSPRDEAPNDPIPHIYPNPSDPSYPYLCLYDPKTNEWTSHSRIRTTIVPWIIDWLSCYEIWLLQGAWVGGGRH